MSTMQSPSSSSSQSGFARLTNWWFRLITPEHSHQPQWREELASFIMPVVLLNVIIPFPSAVGNVPELMTLSTVLLINIVALFLKKMGQFRLAGLLIVAAIEFGLSIAIITWPGLDAAQLPLFALLVQTGFVVIAFFTPPMILVITAFNCAFILIMPHVLRLTDTFQKTLDQQGAGIYIPMIELQLFVALVSVIIMSTLIRAIKRADTAEKLAELEAIEIKRQEEQLLIGRQIEEGIQQILATLNNVVTQSDFAMRVPLKQENILWRVGRSINNLLSRLQGLKQGQEELQKTHAIAPKLAERIRDGQPIVLDSWTGTAFDPVIIEYNKQLRSALGKRTRERSTADRVKP
jgi:hypothetical protein